VFALAAIGRTRKQPLIFASLGTIAYELAVQSRLRSARSFNSCRTPYGLGSRPSCDLGFERVHSRHVLSAGIVSRQRLIMA
jgi:hypothetical protein